MWPIDPIRPSRERLIMSKTIATPITMIAVVVADIVDDAIIRTRTGATHRSE